jgi:hypothetical protein
MVCIILYNKHYNLLDFTTIFVHPHLWEEGLKELSSKKLG